MNRFFSTIAALGLAVLLTGCPQGKGPDKPSTVPQPKALVDLQQTHSSAARQEAS